MSINGAIDVTQIHIQTLNPNSYNDNIATITDTNPKPFLQVIV